jgi:octaprenyl-diphosphate synthase
MAVLPLVVLTALEFDDFDFSASALGTNASFDFAAIENRRAELDIAALADEQHLIELDRVADFGIGRSADLPQKGPEF